MEEKASVLIVDDDESTRKTLRLIFGKKGYEAEAAATGREAMEKARGRFFNLALLDIRLPDMEGVELIAPLKGMHPDTVVIMVTAHASLETAVQALNEGASAYITKPLNMDEVLVTVREALEKQRLVMENRRLYQEAQRELAERKRAEEALKKAYEELREAQEQLIQSEKLAALGRFSSSLAHEIKNPLSVVLGGIGYLEKKLGMVENDIAVALEKIKGSALRADNVIQSLLRFSRPSKLQKERVKPEDLITETLSLLEYNGSLKNVRVKKLFSEDDLYIEVDKIQIQQVLVNLLLNAAEAMPKRGGEINIRIYREASSELHLEQPTCVIQITDTGEGISKQDLPRLYEPFFTTKRDKKGTGLGLSISKMIVDNHKGSLVIDSQPGRGTDVKLFLRVDGGDGHD